MSFVITTLDLVGVAVFAISGALAAAEKRLDILGFILFGTITGIGGGTLRDLLLNTDQVFWISDTRYLWVCLATAIVTWFLAPQFQSLRTLLLWADALGLALFSVLGTAKALAWDAPFIVAAGMGMMTATFGSLIRDSLLGRPPVLLEPDIEYDHLIQVMDTVRSVEIEDDGGQPARADLFSAISIGDAP